MSNTNHEQVQESELLTVREVAKRLRVDETTVRRWITNGILEAISLPHKGKRQSYRVHIDTLNKVLSQNTVTAIGK